MMNLIVAAVVIGLAIKFGAKILNLVLFVGVIFIAYQFLKDPTGIMTMVQNVTSGLADTVITNIFYRLMP